MVSISSNCTGACSRCSRGEPGCVPANDAIINFVKVKQKKPRTNSLKAVSLSQQTTKCLSTVVVKSPECCMKSSNMLFRDVVGCVQVVLNKNILCQVGIGKNILDYCHVNCPISPIIQTILYFLIPQWCVFPMQFLCPFPIADTES